jgi:hypothetical protein
MWGSIQGNCKGEGKMFATTGNDTVISGFGAIVVYLGKCR